MVMFHFVTGSGTPVRQVLGKSKMLLGLVEGIPTMLKGEIAMVFVSFCIEAVFPLLHICKH